MSKFIMILGACVVAAGGAVYALSTAAPDHACPFGPCAARVAECCPAGDCCPTGPCCAGVTADGRPAATASAAPAADCCPAGDCCPTGDCCPAGGNSRARPATADRAE